MAIGARVPTILADTMVIAVTWIKMHQQVKEAFGLCLKVTTSTILLADGTPRVPLLMEYVTAKQPFRKHILRVSMSLNAFMV